MEEEFIEFMKISRHLSDSSVKSYVFALYKVSQRLQEVGLITGSIFNIAESYNVKRLRDKLFSDSFFMECNARGHNLYSAALNNYCMFLEYSSV